MEQACVAKKISPMLATDNMHETIRFYEDVLGFRAISTSPTYSIIERDGQTVHFQKAASAEVMKCMREHTEIYIEVCGIDVLWEHVREFGERYRVRELFDREYGMTEFHIADPNGVLVFVGEVTANRKAATTRSGISPRV